MPGVLADFLSEHWRQWLVQVWLREGTDSPRFAEARALGRTLVALDAGVEGHALAGKLLALESTLRECLAISGLQDDAATAELSKLVAEYADPDVPVQQRTLSPIASGAGVVVLAEPVRDFAAGDRLTRTLETGAMQGLTLAWLSPLSGTVLLVDAQGARQAVLTADALRDAIARGSMRHRTGGDPVALALARIETIVSTGDAVA